MRDFYARRINLLVCSTIIENGIDVPTANTIIINRADKVRPGPSCISCAVAWAARITWPMPT